MDEEATQGEKIMSLFQSASLCSDLLFDISRLSAVLCGLESVRCFKGCFCSLIFA